MDSTGRILAINDAAEGIFGLTHEQAVGRDMADTMVPPDLREAHRHGLARLVAGGRPVMIGTRIEIRAQDVHGREFPVELTLTQVEYESEPVFMAYIRDITDRRAAEQEVLASRARIVAASDAARRRVERDLHDGAQQRLVLCGMLLGELEAVLQGGGDETRELVAQMRGELDQATVELRDLARGIYPSVLTDGGLGPAVRAAAGRCPVPVELVALPAERFGSAAEMTAYFIVVEALTNIARGVGATVVRVAIRNVAGALEIEVVDDGRGGVELDGSSGLRGLTDRAVALGGTFSVHSPAGAGTRLLARLPTGNRA